MDGPTIGRIVHVWIGMLGDWRPAIITNIGTAQNTHGIRVSVVAFGVEPENPVLFLSDISEQSSSPLGANSPLCWRWPPRN